MEKIPTAIQQKLQHLEERKNDILWTFMRAKGYDENEVVVDKERGVVMTKEEAQEATDGNLPEQLRRPSVQGQNNQ